MGLSTKDRGRFLVLTRFLNCDDTAILLATQGETHNANLFAYCANNPVNRVDKTGYDSKEMSLQELDVYLTAFYSGWLIKTENRPLSNVANTK